jgi:hypothetical protein
MVFFQAALLAGYAYAHAVPRWLGVRRQAGFHLALLLLPFLVLPLAIAPGWKPPGQANPIPWLLGLLSVSVGLPFIVVSTSGPLLQRWFANTGHRAAHDPYFLYTASNLGSMIALLSYPILIEPALTLADQRRLWAIGYAVLVILTALCAVCLWRSAPASAPEPGPTTSDAWPIQAPEKISRWRRLRWVALAFVPSSLMLSATTYLTTDIAAIPLLWIIPLSLYLLSFILVFARRPLVPHAWMVRLLPLTVLLLILAMLSEATEPIWLLLLIHLLALFIIAMVCHGELARDRPQAAHLTEFYLWLSAGGVLGGLCNALVAPLVFSTVAEYPLVVILACLIRPPIKSPRAKKRPPDPRFFAPKDLVFPLLLGIGTAGLVVAVRAFGRPFQARLESLGLEEAQANLGLMYFLPAVICYTFLGRPVRFALGVVALLVAGLAYPGIHGRVLYRERSFFGVHRVTLNREGTLHELVHGNTVHGRQSLDPAQRHEPLTYYHRTGPIGQVFTAFPNLPHVAVVGLGAGSLAAFSRPGQEFVYFEIDPTVVRIARDPAYFTFLSDAAAPVEIVLGDARLTLNDAPAHHYNLLVLDAFSSDAIPLHLLTREAMQLYLSKLAAGGLLAFHVSNRYLDLEPVLGDLAEDTGLVCRIQKDVALAPEETQAGKSPSIWVLMARREQDLGKLARSWRWDKVTGRNGAYLWTDDFSNLFRVFQWK